MKRINVFEKEDFLFWIVSKMDRVQKGEHTNLQHTHDEIHYNPETGLLTLEEVCINQDGNVFGRNIFGEAYIPIEWNIFLPEELVEDGSIRI